MQYLFTIQSWYSWYAPANFIDTHLQKSMIVCWLLLVCIDKGSWMVSWLNCLKRNLHDIYLTSKPHFMTVNSFTMNITVCVYWSRSSSGSVSSLAGEICWYRCFHWGNRRESIGSVYFWFQKNVHYAKLATPGRLNEVTTRAVQS